jgi:hypothetical protein
VNLGIKGVRVNLRVINLVHVPRTQCVGHELAPSKDSKLKVSRFIIQGFGFDGLGLRV